MTAVLALDQGGQSSRAVVFDGDLGVVASARRAVGDVRPAADRVEQNPEEIVASLVESAREALDSAARHGVLPERAGLATQRSSVVCWDRSTGTALSPVLSWQDRRGAARTAALAARAADVHRRTGLVLSPHYGATKLAWCVDELPAVRAALAAGTLAFGPLASFLAFRLTRERMHLVDPANASRTQLVSLATGGWDDELLELFGVPRAPLPACVPTRHAWGTLIEAAAPRPLPLAVVQGDQPAALFAFGEPRDDTVYLNLGTGAFLQRPAEGALADPAPLLASVVLADERGARFVLEGTVNGAASAIEELARELGVDDPVAALPRWLDEVRDPPLFLNGVSGVGSPFWIPDFRSRFVGEGDTDTDMGARMVAVVESIAFLVRSNLDAFERRLPRATRIVATGGLSRLDGLCTRIASLAGTPLERPPALEATATGLARLVAGAWAPQVVATPDVVEPRSDDALEQRFVRWSAEMPAAQLGSATR